MCDLAILFSIISLFVGVASISIFINRICRNRTLELFIGLNLSFFLIQNSITLILYWTRVEQPLELILILSKILDTTGTSLISFFGMLLINSFLIKEISPKKIFTISAIAIFQFIIITFHILFNISYLEYLVKISIFLVIIYEVLLAIINYKWIGNKDLKKAINIFTSISIIFLPLFVFEDIRPYIPFLHDIITLKTLSLPLYFLIVNAFSLIFANKYFNSPNYIESNKLTEFFIKKL